MNRFDIRSGTSSWTVRREGSAYLVNVASRTDYSADLAAGKSVDFPLAVGVWSADWVSGALSVKYSARTAWATSSRVDVIVQNMAIIPEEPQTTFIEATNIVATSSWLQATAGNNRLETVAFAPPLGPQLRVILRISAPAAAAGIIGVTLTVDLVGRTS